MEPPTEFDTVEDPARRALFLALQKPCEGQDPRTVLAAFVDCLALSIGFCCETSEEAESLFLIAAEGVSATVVANWPETREHRRRAFAKKTPLN